MLEYVDLWRWVLEREAQTGGGGGEGLNKILCHNLLKEKEDICHILLLAFADSHNISFQCSIKLEERSAFVSPQRVRK